MDFFSSDGAKFEQIKHEIKTIKEKIVSLGTTEQESSDKGA